MTDEKLNNVHPNWKEMYKRFLDELKLLIDEYEDNEYIPKKDVLGIFVQYMIWQ